MTENEIKAIKWIKNVRDDAVIALDHIQKNEPNVNPMSYAGRKKKAETIMEMFEELEQYRAIGTVAEFKKIEESFNVISDKVWNYILAGKELLERYEAIGTIEEFKTLKEKSVTRKIKGTRFKEAICPNCETELFETYWAFGGIHYCSNCGQKLDWQ